MRPWAQINEPTVSRINDLHAVRNARAQPQSIEHGSSKQEEPADVRGESTCEREFPTHETILLLTFGIHIGEHP